MCGRFTLKTPASDWVQQLFPGLTILDMPNLPPRYNIAPTQSILTLTTPEPKSDLRACIMRWGLVPPWSADLAIGNNMINARGETVAEKPSFRKALVKRRCVIIADGYYEWLRTEKTKRPFWIHRQDNQAFCMAGLWEANHKVSPKETLLTTTIITTPANQVTSAVHDRMPVIFDTQDALRWLDPELEDGAEINSLIRAAPNDWWSLTEVNSHVNNARNEGAKCLEPVAANNSL